MIRRGPWNVVSRVKVVVWDNLRRRGVLSGTRAMTCRFHLDRSCITTKAVNNILLVIEHASDSEKQESRVSTEVVPLCHRN
jgi:hypothetical protein